MQLGLDIIKTTSAFTSLNIENVPKQKDLPKLPDKRVAQTILDEYLKSPVNELFPIMTQNAVDEIMLQLYDRNILMDPPSSGVYALFYGLLAFATKIKEGWHENKEWEMVVNSESYLRAVYSLIPDLLFNGGDVTSIQAILILVRTPFTYHLENLAYR